MTWLFLSLLFGTAAYLDRAAEAQCVQNGTTVTCTGALGNVSFTAPAVRTLNVGSLTATATWVSLTGTGSAPGAGGDSHFACSPNPGDCDITIGVNAADTCEPKPDAPEGTVCVESAPAAFGPTGNAGPTVTISAVTDGFLITPGSSAATVFGRSRGSNGGAGGNAYGAGTAGNGASGANGGNVTVVLDGNASPASGRAGIVAASLAGDGGNGGYAYVTAGGSGSGGFGGFGGDANASHPGGTIVTTGRGAVGIAAFSQGGNGGDAGGGFGIFTFTTGDGGSAGQAGTAQVFTGADSNIVTSGDYAYGILAQSLGGGGGSGTEGFGLFYSGAGGGSTGGAGGLVIVNANGTITTHGRFSHGILAQSIGGGGGDAGEASGLVALGANGAGGGAGRDVSVSNAGSVTTFGFGANAIEAQSIGGGGGNGSSTLGAVALGGNGAGTSTGGAVTVANFGPLTTWGERSIGLLAQSIGGGGGNGGTSGGLFSWGGKGGAGANADQVTVFNGGDIRTGLNGAASANSHGILVQSIGGGGGNGGGAIAVDVTQTGASAAFGGSGGTGGNGSRAQLLLDNPISTLATPYTVETFGARSHAVMVQSIGGGGGNGGFAVSGSLVVALGVGGNGSPGGTGGLVDVATKGTIITHQDDSMGIVAQSIGGGGGNGGFALTASGGASVSVGGGGGIGGGSSAVVLSSLSHVSTFGDNSHGILAQSIGGGGGNGGFSGAASLAVSVGVGGSGGQGGASDLVTLSSIGSVSTRGENAMGVVAQSLGGGGGNGGFSAALGVGVGSVTVAVGGSGASGGISRDVNLFQDGLVTTAGSGAPGIVGQSIGGGGGNGGGAFSLAGGAAMAVAVGVGGKGGGGAESGGVTVVTDGAGVVTLGEHSPGIRAQSIGGGGGNGGFSMGIAASATFYGVGGSAAVSVGGSGGSAGNSRNVLVNSTGSLFTNGSYSHGIEAQSIGGGGGNGGFSVAGAFTLGQVAAGVAVGGGGSGGGTSDTVTVIASGAGGQTSMPFGVTSLHTNGAQAHGILAQSIGGGGGNGGFAGAIGVALSGASGGVGVGGGGGVGATSEVVDVTSYHNIVTTGDRSIGILAQSIGGGGGNGGFSMGLGGGSVFGGAVSVGGTGDGGGNSNSVFLKSYGTVATQGLEAHGIFAQSIGGGGGNGGASVSGTFTTGPVAASVAVGGSGAGGGAAGPEVNLQGYAAGLSGAPVLAPPAPGFITLSTLGAASHGIFAQSIGGGGGNGGFAGALAVATGGVAVGVPVGGSGAGGGDSGLVRVTTAHNILTTGERSMGIFAQSIGGGGGNGGFSLGLGGGSTAGGAVAVGGSGDGGGNSGSVYLTSYGTVATLGLESHGIFAQSIGGGGGNGGSSISGSFSPGQAALGVAVGGSGAGGGSAGDEVVVSSFATSVNGVGSFIPPPAFQVTLATAGDASNGIFAQSIGGGGGNGGFAGSAGIATGGFGVGFSVGGNGAGGGDGGVVSVNSVHNILTAGAASHGILAQSIGGGGGNGGFTLGFGGGSQFGGSAAIGGYGDTGGSAANVTATSRGVIRTMGDDSHGVAAQSLGGGGGNGGFAISGSFSTGPGGLGIAVGGHGAGGGASGVVTVNSYAVSPNGALPAFGIGTLITEGNRSNGILAQSIGGGGGNGGFSVGGGGATGEFGIGISVGGFGGGGGGASSVEVNSAHNVITNGLFSNGILAQSIGGGGGNGGFSLALGAGARVGGSASLGGFGDTGGNASFVTTNHTGRIWTVGDDSNGILAQSLGGGGGNGGFSISGAFTAGRAGVGLSVGGFGAGGGAAESVTVNAFALSANGAVVPPAADVTLVTEGDRSAGILAQSLGGGGGNGGFSAGGGFATGDIGIGVSVGGFGAGGGASGSVQVSSVHNILTDGLNSYGIFAQSLGGGGGNGGFSLGLGASAKLGGAVSVGGFALGGGGDASFVTVDHKGAIRTKGDDSHGIFAQSIGGGGGNGGVALSGALAVDDDGGSVSVGGKGSNGGLAGAVTVNSNVGRALGELLTIQTDSGHGIFAQSIGGGGGNGGLAGSLTLTGSSSHALSVSVGGSGGAGNSASTVTITSNDNILTRAAGSAGIFAQSIGGGGGNGGMAFAGTLTFPEGDDLNITGAWGGTGGSGANSGIVTVTANGHIRTQGDGADGVIAQSLGGGGGNGRIAVAGVANACKSCPGKQGSVTASVGGFGGAGGAGADATITFGGTVVTTGEEAVGLRAQSIGGGGGNGGIAISGAISGGASQQFTGALGGFGGAGSEAGNVTVTSTGDISTGSLTTQSVQIALPGRVFVPIAVNEGRQSHGILAQSIGGGGGNGGLAIAGAIGRVGMSKNISFGATVGGFGGSGGFAGTVTVTNEGQITTAGHDAHGIVAQSIGGGGGNGGGAVSGVLAAGNPTATTGKPINVSLALGGFGGDGNLGGNVTVTQSGGIRTFGEGSYGILAQSIGGGGGTGGGANSISLMLGTECTYDGTIPGESLLISICSQTDAEKEADKKKKRGKKFEAAVGGFGGVGNDAGIVAVTNHGSIDTVGAHAVAIKAQSIGGGGGSGGHGISGVKGLFPSMVKLGPIEPDTVVGLADTFFNSAGDGKLDELAFTLGGKGGNAGNGGAVFVTNNGAITTAGFSAKGLFAQSVGGGGGDGGESDTGDGYVSIGGFGGAAGNGGVVTIENGATGRIITTGEQAHAIFGQSIGGGGGSGGSATGFIAIGGVGGSPQPFIDFVDNVDFMNLFPITSLPTTGHGGEVRITNLGVLGTSGAFAHGIVGQSVGGGGGELTGNGNGGGVGSSKIAFGGWGATSGDGGLVTIENSGSITTNGKGADAIRGQSVGGGGGNGGDTSGGLAVVTRYVSVGGQAGAAGSGGAVIIKNSNALVTFGDQADGIFAQSVGGGGGDAGQAVGLVGLGGQRGGSAGDGGAVTVTNNVGGSIWTHGANANGIYAQSTGGGGGTAGVTVNVLTVTLPGNAWLFLGGGDGAGGAGGAVTVDNHAAIRTEGASSQGIFAQSVGGGGGAGAVTASAINVSILPVTVGGSGIGGSGGTVNVTNHSTGTILTNGASSTGIFAQSVGGGGGTADIGASLVTFSIGPGGGVRAPAILGGTGGSGGNGGAVTVDNNGAIVVNGPDSIGIMAQSIGGGGGTAKVFTVREFGNPLFTTPKFEFTLGGTTGVVGQGGDVTVNNTGSITINGDNSLGIFAQSVGGGGGLVAPGSGVGGLTLSEDGSGNSGTVTVNNTAGAIFLNGANSVALFSQSVAGGGGAAFAAPVDPAMASDARTQAAGDTASTLTMGGLMFAGSAGGRGVARPMTLNQRGHLIATGLNSNALVAQSHGFDGSGDITINILNASPDRPSMIVGGTGTGAGVFIMNGARNQLNNGGLIASMLGFDGFAVRAGTGDDRVVNTGTIIGSIDLGTGQNIMFNNPGGTFLAGRVIELGGGTLTNEGIFSPGGEGHVMSTKMSGNFVQPAGGTFRMDLDLRSLSADRLNITGSTTLAGRLELNLIDPVGTAMRTRPGTNDFPIAMTTGGAGQTQLQLVAPNTAVATYSLVAPTMRETTLRSVVDFSPVGMSANARALGDVVNAIQSAQQSPSFGPLAASLFFQPDVATLGTTYESLGGAAVVGVNQASMTSADRFLAVLGDQTGFWLGNQAHASNGFAASRDRALEAAAFTSSRSRTPSFTTPKEWRMWVTGFDGRNELAGDTAVGSVDTTTRGGGMVGGFDFQVSPRLLVGAAAGRGTFDFDAAQAETQGESAGIHVAGYSAYRRTSYYATGTLAFSFYENEVSRRAFVPATSVPVSGGAGFAAGEEFPDGTFNSRSISAAAEGGYRWTFGHFEVSPFAGVQFVSLDSDAYTETASGGPSVLGMTRMAQTASSLPTFLGAQWKVEGDLAKDKVLSVFVRGSWKHELRTGRTIESEFNAAPDFRFVLHGAEPFEDALRTSLGVRQTLGRGLAFYAYVDGEFAGSRRALAGSAGLRAGW